MKLYKRLSTVNIISGIVLSAAMISTAVNAEDGPDVSLTRLDCGTAPAEARDVGRFSDTYAYPELRVNFTYSCYLIKHNEHYMVWDAGQPDNGNASAPKKNLQVLLSELNIKPEQVNYLGISHYHGDHTGQASLLPHSTLLIGKGDWDAITNGAANAKPFEPWISGGGKVEALSGDKDVFGDGSVVVLTMPGHTPGHSSLLVKLKDTGNVLISGDLAHFQENYDNDGVPSFNTNRADTLASLDRFKKIAKNLNAKLIIQHDARHIERLPTFPAAAK